MSLCPILNVFMNIQLFLPIMNHIAENLWPECLLTFLRVIKDSDLDKSILDCGAGGRRPPLAFFKQLSFETYGIDISQKSLELAKRYESDKNIILNIQHGDMKELPFDDSSISFIYTQNSLCHLSKKDHSIVINEINRVLKVGGYCLVDFMSAESSYCTEEEMGELVGENEYVMRNGDSHSFFVDNEPDNYFCNMNVTRVDKIITKLTDEKNPMKHVRYYYYAQKR